MHAVASALQTAGNRDPAPAPAKYNRGMTIRPAAGFCLLGAVLLFAQDWKTATTLPAVDMDGLTAAQKATVLKILRAHDCTCGCNMKMAQCRVEDPGCSFSRGLASVIVGAVKQGKSEPAAMAAASGRSGSGSTSDSSD